LVVKNTAARHSKGWAGLAFVILIVAQIVLMGLNAPPANAPVGTITAYLSSHQHALLIAGWLNFPITGFLLWFAVGISEYLRQESQVDDGLPTFALIMAVTTAAIALVGQLFITLLAFGGAGMSAAEVSALWLAQAMASNVFLAMPAAFFVFAVAHSMRRHESAPWWLAWLGYLAALAQAMMTFGLFSPSAIPGDSMLLLGLSFMLFVLWMISTAAYLVALPGKEAAAGAA
jgi:hypothetical protein